MDSVGTAEAQRLSDRLRRVHARFPTGLTIVTTAVDGVPYGLALNAFVSVSLEPAVVLFCVAKSSRTHVHLGNARHAAVNFLSHQQSEIAKRFSRSGGDKFKGFEWFAALKGSPVLAGVSAWIEVEFLTKADALTHTIFAAGVLEAMSTEVPPLVYLASGLFDGARLAAAH
jgi:flavin reductase (DIM6/NTAB) family NADH-FMN oxidoreductase RutF